MSRTQKKTRKTTRKIDLRKIRPTATYTLPELAKQSGKSKHTIWRYRREGMPTIPGSDGQLVDGAEFIAWIIKRREARKRPCAVDEFFCFGAPCRTQRNPAIGSVYIRKTNQNLGSIEANCASCGTKLKKGFAMADFAEIEAVLESYIGNIQDLARYRDSPP